MRAGIIYKFFIRILTTWGFFSVYFSYILIIDNRSLTFLQPHFNIMFHITANSCVKSTLTTNILNGSQVVLKYRIEFLMYSPPRSIWDFSNQISYKICRQQNTKKLIASDILREVAWRKVLILAGRGRLEKEIGRGNPNLRQWSR